MNEIRLLLLKEPGKGSGCRGIAFPIQAPQRELSGDSISKNSQPRMSIRGVLGCRGADQRVHPQFFLAVRQRFHVNLRPPHWIRMVAEGKVKDLHGISGIGILPLGKLPPF
jgi:hypothetical protein